MRVEARIQAVTGLGAGPEAGRRTVSNLDLHLSPTSIVDRIGREIVAGHFPQDSLLPPEAIMLERYGVSRTSLREAYSKLMAKGLISARPKVGTSVRAQMHWNMLDPDVLGWHLLTRRPEEIAADLYALRRMIEPGAAETAAQLHTAQDIERIEHAFAEMKIHAGNERQLVAADLRFHLTILEATQNPFINAFSALIHAAMISTFELSWRGAEVIKEQRLEQHGAVARAIRARDPSLARRRMEQLLDDSIEDVSGALASKQV